MLIEIIVNNKKYLRDVSLGKRLIDFLRDDLLLTGTKEGCGEGECGSCTILLDGKPVNSCLLLAVQVHNREITTIEGIRETKLGKKIISSFAELGAIQCGFCTPGLIMNSFSLIKNCENLNPEKIGNAISGNLCRCTGYQKIIEAILKAANV